MPNRVCSRTLFESSIGIATNLPFAGKLLETTDLHTLGGFSKALAAMAFSLLQNGNVGVGVFSEREKPL
jgi:hypothetical protein